MKKQIFILVLIFAVSVVVSGCIKQPVVKQQPVNNQNEIPREEIKYLENGEIDTSDWKTYRNDYYKMEIKYPPFLENVEQNDPNSEDFWIRSPLNKNQEMLNKNWDIQFSKTLLDFQNLPLEEKRTRFKHEDTRNTSFKEIKLNNSFVYYQLGKSKGGYKPGAEIFSKYNILTGSIYIYSEDLDFSEYDPKYINVFKAMLKSIKFDE